MLLELELWARHSYHHWAHKDKRIAVPAVAAAVNQGGCQTHAELTAAQGSEGSADGWASCVAPVARVH